MIKIMNLLMKTKNLVIEKILTYKAYVIIFKRILLIIPTWNQFSKIQKNYLYSREIKDCLTYRDLKC